MTDLPAAGKSDAERIAALTEHVDFLERLLRWQEHQHRGKIDRRVMWRVAPCYSDDNSMVNALEMRVLYRPWADALCGTFGKWWDKDERTWFAQARAIARRIAVKYQMDVAICYDDGRRSYVAGTTPGRCAPIPFLNWHIDREDRFGEYVA